MNAGYSGTPLLKKLGIKAGMNILLLQQPSYYLDLLAPLPEPLQVNKEDAGAYDLVHFFAAALHDLDQLNSLKTLIKSNGCIWVSWEKKKSKQPGAVNENKLRDAALPIGLVDIKVCAVDETWSALKLVIRKELRS